MRVGDALLAPTVCAGYSPSMPGSKDRSERLAAALRANLSRRKAQSRARRSGEVENAPARAAGNLPESAPLASSEPGQSPLPAAEMPLDGANSGENPARGGSTALATGAAKIVPDGEPG